ncbi:MAG: hypothetical protein WDW38_002682 [Sanguina aurantia]
MHRRGFALRQLQRIAALRSELELGFQRQYPSRERTGNGAQGHRAAPLLGKHRGLAAGGILVGTQQHAAVAHADHVTDAQQGFFSHRPRVDMDAAGRRHHLQHHATAVLADLQMLRGRLRCGQHEIVTGSAANRQLRLRPVKVIAVLVVWNCRVLPLGALGGCWP